MQPGTIERFIEYHSDVEQELRDEDFHKEVKVLARWFLHSGRSSDTWQRLELVAIHEKGHEIYYRKAGFTEFKYVPPVVVYKPENKEKRFEGQIARIIPIPESYTQPAHNDWLLDLAKGYAAGGVCSRELTEFDYDGATKDRENWGEMCADCYKDLGFEKKELEAIAGDLWDKAETAVYKDLESQRFRMQIRHEAKEIIPQLFPWSKYV